MYEYLLLNEAYCKLRQNLNQMQELLMKVLMNIKLKGGHWNQCSGAADFLGRLTPAPA